MCSHRLQRTLMRPLKQWFGSGHRKLQSRQTGAFLKSLEVWMRVRIIRSHKDQSKAINTKAHDLTVGGREECDICDQSTRRYCSATIISFVKV